MLRLCFTLLVASHSWTEAFVPTRLCRSMAVSNSNKEVRHSKLAASQIDTDFFRREKRITFGAKLLIDEIITSINAEELQLYVSNPKNVLSAAWPRKLIEDRQNGLYRLRQEPINFAGLVVIENAIDVKISSDESGCIHMDSKNLESIAKIGAGMSERVEIDLNLHGILNPIEKFNNGARVKGDVRFEVSGDLIGPLQFAPNGVLEAAANAVNRGILEYARREFVRGIERSYRQWKRN